MRVYTSVCYNTYMKRIEFMGQPPENPTQSDKAYRFLHEAILTHQLKAGFPILESEIATQIGMSRTPVREAINRLKAEGLLEAVPRKGVFVKTLSKEEIRHIYEMAEALEGMIAYTIAENFQNCDFSNLDDAVAKMQLALQIDDIESWSIADESYHKALYSLCQNSYLINGISKMNNQIHLMRFTIPTRKEISFKEHQLTVKAIKIGDKAGAREMTQKHWERVRGEILALVN